MDETQVPHNEAGLTALIFTSEGDMRQAVNNLQSTFSGFNFVGAEEVFKVCDQPHPVKVQALISSCAKGDIDHAMTNLEDLWKQGYAAVDIVTTLFRVTKNMDSLAEYIKLEFIKVRSRLCVLKAMRSRLPSSGDWLRTHEDSRRVLDGRPARRLVGPAVSLVDEAGPVRGLILQAMYTLPVRFNSRGFGV